MRRRQFAAHAPAPMDRATVLSTLCIIRGCLNRRLGANLCAEHDRITDELAAR